MTLPVGSNGILPEFKGAGRSPTSETVTGYSKGNLCPPKQPQPIHAILRQTQRLQEDGTKALHGLRAACIPTQAHQAYSALRPRVCHLDTRMALSQRPNWLYEPPENVHNFKASYIWAAPWNIPKDIAKEYEVLWPLVSKLVITWASTYLDAGVAGMLGNLSDDHVLDAMKQEGSFTFPESGDRDWDWAQFHVE
ncbi:hypothetical protein NMY22_g2243 [Coprinellus aureogranulatus]|nr:hypothetical protein NMY22_g2243 [Coprinellus aureogranulatus]